jgi:hypothetical protein
MCQAERALGLFTLCAIGRPSSRPREGCAGGSRRSAARGNLRYADQPHRALCSSSAGLSTPPPEHCSRRSQEGPVRLRPFRAAQARRRGAPPSDDEAAHVDELFPDCPESPSPIPRSLSWAQNGKMPAHAILLHDALEHAFAGMCSIQARPHGREAKRFFPANEPKADARTRVKRVQLADSAISLQIHRSVRTLDSVQLHRTPQRSSDVFQRCSNRGIA